jgi:hypothetical protein
MLSHISTVGCSCQSNLLLRLRYPIKLSMNLIFYFSKAQLLRVYSQRT